MPPRAMATPTARRPLAFARLRTAHDCTIRDLVQTSWDVVPDPSPEPFSRHEQLQRRNSPPPSLPPRSATDISGAAIQAARMAEMAAQEAADASAAARAAAAYARRLAEPVQGGSCRVLRLEGGKSQVPASPVSNGAEISSQQNTFRMPIPVTVPVGKVWSVDVVAMWHNAVRLDLTDLLDILDSMSNRHPRADVTLAELRAMFAWFSTFEAFVVTALKAEEEVLFPWLEQWGRIEGELSTASRITTKGTIIRGIRDTAACSALVGLDKNLPAGMVLTNPDRHYYDGLKVGFAEAASSRADASDASLRSDVLRKVNEHVAAFSTLLLEYFQEQERSLPAIIERLYDMEDMLAASIERRMIRAIWKCGRKDESMIMLLRAVDDSPIARQWMGRNLRRIERFTMPLSKRRYNAARGAVVAKFKQRKQHWEHSAASLGAPRDTSGFRFNVRGSSATRSTPAVMSTPNYPVRHDNSFNMSSSSSDTIFPSQDT